METVASDTTGRGRAPLMIAAMVVLLAASIAALLVSRRDGGSSASDSTTSSTSAPAEQVSEFSGNGDQDTAPFQVSDGWEVRWESSGTTFKLAIDGDQDFGTVVEHQGEGGGSTYPVGAGTFRLHVSADGPWTIRVINHAQK